MNDNEKQFEDFVHNIKFDDAPDPAHRDKLEQKLLYALGKHARQGRPIEIWRIIMESRITKLAAAAVIIIAVMLSINLLDKTVTPAYAIEQTLEAMERFNAVYLSGTFGAFGKGFGAPIVGTVSENNQTAIEIWAQVNKQGTRSGNIKIKSADGMVGVADETQSKFYIPQTNTIFIQQGSYIMIDPWPSQNFLMEKQSKSEDWKVLHGKDPSTGRNRIFATCHSTKNESSWWFEFDEESKLLVRFKQWDNIYRQGKPDYDIQKIVYHEELPDEIFKLEAPEDAKIFEGIFPFMANISEFSKLNDPSHGISVEGLNKDEACRKILGQFWQAIKGHDFNLIRKLLPITADWEDETLVGNLGLNDEDDIVEVLEIGSPSDESATDIGPVVIVPSIIKCKDGKTREIKLIIQFRQIDGQSSCFVYSNSGKARELD